MTVCSNLEDMTAARRVPAKAKHLVSTEIVLLAIERFTETMLL